jgi:hypothetical protein
MALRKWLSVRESTPKKNRNHYTRRKTASRLNLELLEGRFVPTVLVVNKNVPADFQTIQSAVDAASTTSVDTIMVTARSVDSQLGIGRARQL